MKQMRGNLGVWTSLSFISSYRRRTLFFLSFLAAEIQRFSPRSFPFQMADGGRGSYGFSVGLRHGVRADARFVQLLCKTHLPGRLGGHRHAARLYDAMLGRARRAPKPATFRRLDLSLHLLVVYNQKLAVRVFLFESFFSMPLVELRHRHSDGRCCHRWVWKPRTVNDGSLLPLHKTQSLGMPVNRSPYFFSMVRTCLVDHFPTLHRRCFENKT